jgi:hypothetical protein
MPVFSDSLSPVFSLCFGIKKELIFALVIGICFSAGNAVIVPLM